MAILFGFVIFLHFRGNGIQERSLMNVGYGMMGLIVLNIAFNLVSLLLTSLLSLIHFCKRKQKKIQANPLKEE